MRAVPLCAYWCFNSGGRTTTTPMATTAAATMKMPPAFEDENAYEIWKEDLEIWCDLTDLPASKRALAVRLVLTGRARAAASSQVKREDLKKDDGVQILLKKLDGEFLVEKGRRQFAAFNEMYNFRRSDKHDVSTFVSCFEHGYFKFTQQGMTLPDTVLAFMLLRAGNLSDVERKLVMSAISEVTYNNMKSALRRVFCEDAPENSSTAVAEVKSEPVFYGNEEEETALYTRGGGRGRRPWRGGRGGRRGVTGANRVPVATRGGRHTNRMGSDGEVTRCFICDSRFHWARDCPDAFENKNGESSNAEDESVQLSLFMGYTSDARNAKLQGLISESRGCAVLDSGCTNTVCGVEWFNKYISTLSDFQLQQIEESESTSTFTFGDGVTVTSLKKIKLPCNIGGMKADITTDVVDCAVPLLLSNRAMRKAKMCIDFGKDVATIGKSDINLKCSASGHYLLPLSM